MKVFSSILPAGMTGIAATAALTLSATATAQINSSSSNTGVISGNEFNPSVSVILNGGVTDYSSDEEYELHGFILGGEAGLNDEGFSVFETELSFSANVDDLFYGFSTIGLHQHEGEIEVDVEEAWFQTIGLGNGFTVKGGQFFSDIGYHNVQHSHSWDFADAPLVYRGIFGQRYADTGVQVSWIAPTDMFLELSAEWMRGTEFPTGGGDNGNKGAYVAMATIGGDISASSSWQIGLSGLFSNDNAIGAGGHEHGHDEEEEEEGGEEHGEADFTADVRIVGLDMVYKWAPNGNSKQTNLTLQAEIFNRIYDGNVSIEEEDGTSTVDYQGTGFYLQGVYQFMPQWRVGLRYDRMMSDISGSEDEVLEEAGFEAGGYDPQRTSVMVDWTHTEYSRLRLQYNFDQSREDENDSQIFLQYILSLGAHGAHRF